ncbi:hypothetical protein [Bacillus sp. Marseille-P3661]|uniref:hypothetical protein n=1 Tax=Bacillus sp. Marseille-P3661 TaxID=1936234 RepID=UPI000C825F82|nr:hypothetical protein [Bacillus sp. Marseille-P3661]
MLILQSGITGFQPAPTIEENVFKQICFSLFGSKLVKYRYEEDETKNFYDCLIYYNEQKFNVLLNMHYPFIAFAENRGAYHFSFIDDPNLRKMFESYYTVLSSNELNEPLHFSQKGKKIIIKNDNTLHKYELEQIMYWQPKTVGDIVFNFWD